MFTVRANGPCRPDGTDLWDLHLRAFRLMETHNRAAAAAAATATSVWFRGRKPLTVDVYAALTYVQVKI